MPIDGFEPRPPVIAGAAVLLVAVWLAVSTIRQYLRLRHIKGPPIAGFTQAWLIRSVARGRAHIDQWEVCEKYGDIARIGPNELITSNPELLRRMLHVRTPYKRSAWYDAMRLDPAKDNVLSQRDDELHASLRSKMAAGYSGKEVENLESRIDENLLRLVNLLETKYVSQGKAFDFGRKAHYFTLDVIADLAFGEPFGDLETDSDVYGYIQILEKTIVGVILASVMPWIMGMLRFPLFKGMLPSDKDKDGVGRVMAIAKKVTAERFGPEPKVQRDMLGSFIARGMGQSEAESEILMQILAGSDTTATAVRATLLHIISNSRVLEALRHEIDQAKPSWPVIRDDEARAMPYLQAVIKEGLRTHPPVVGLMSKQVPPGGDTFNGVYLPEGTKIGYCAWGTHRRKDIWGDDANEFRPERWLEASGERLRLMESTLDLVFGYGRWQCLGRNIALLELNKVFVELVRRFDLVVVNPDQPWHSVNTGIFLQSDFWIRGYKRKNV